MSLTRQQFGSVTVARARNGASLRRLLKDPWLKTDTVIVKPNWVRAMPGLFTDSDTLRLLFEALDTNNILVTEGYQIHRMTNEQDRGMKFTVNGKEVDWEWLMKAGWKWLTEQENWDWFKNAGQWAYLRKQDEMFLDEYGFTDLFKEYNAEYINVTEEVWNGRTVNPQEIKKIVERKFTPVYTDKVYRCVPQKLYDLRGSTLISFSKVKHYVSFSMKNLFGLLPDPARAWWHGKSDKRLHQSIVDVNKVYASLFNVFGVCEALRNTAVSNPKGELGEPEMKYNIAKDLDVLAFGRQLVPLDAVMHSLLGLDPAKVTYLELGAEAFGAYEKSHVEAAKTSGSNWFSFSLPA